MVYCSTGKKNLDRYLTRNNFEEIDIKKGITLNEGVQYSNISNSSTDSIPSTNSIVKDDLRYSLNDATDLSDFWFNNDNLEEPIGNAASILEEGAQLLQGKEVDTDTIRKIARGMIKEYQSHYDVDTLSENLEKLFSYMQTQDT